MKTNNLLRPSYRFDPETINSSWLAEFDLHAEGRDNFISQLEIRSGTESAKYAKTDTYQCSAIFKGILYNRSDLARENRIEESSELTDAEFLLRLYVLSGSKIIEKLRGIFNLLIWDAGQGILIGTRDPLGFEPLFYAHTNSTVIFSNSIDTLLQHPDIHKEINRPALADYLSRRFPFYDETYYLGIKRVLVGHCLTFQKGHFDSFQYWDPSPPGTPDDSMTEADLEEFEYFLEQAVDRCLSFGKPGIFLSGGLDSVSVAAVATDLTRKKNFPEPLALSLVFPDPVCNEEDVQKNVANELAIEQILVPFNDAVEESGLIYGSASLSGVFPQPTYNPWRIAYNTLASQGVKNDCKVILTGVGGDDWLTVNPDHMADLISQLDIMGSLQLINALQRSFVASRIPVYRYLLWTIGLRPIIASSARKTLNSLIPDQFYKYRYKRLARVKKTPDWIAPDPELQKQLEARTNKSIDEMIRRPEPSGPYGYYKHDARSTTYTHPVLTLELEEDFEVGKLFGIKLLHPYWDADLIQFLCRIPPHLLLKGGRDKGIVRQAIANRFPNVDFERQRKIIAGGFIKNTLNFQGMAAFERIGGLQYLTKLGIIRPVDENFISNLLANPDLNESIRVWELLTLEAWLKSHL